MLVIEGYMNHHVFTARNKYAIGTKLEMMVKPISAAADRFKGKDNRHKKIGKVISTTDNFIVVKFKNYRETFLWHDVAHMKIKIIGGNKNESRGCSSMH